MFGNIQNKGVRSDVGPILITARNVSKLINNKGREEKSIYLLVCDFLPLGCFPKVVDRLSIVEKRRKFFLKPRRTKGSGNWPSWRKHEAHRPFLHWDAQKLS